MPLGVSISEDVIAPPLGFREDEATSSSHKLKVGIVPSLVVATFSWSRMLKVGDCSGTLASMRYVHFSLCFHLVVA